MRSRVFPHPRISARSRLALDVSLDEHTRGDSTRSATARDRASRHRVHARYRTSNVDVVDQELRLELARLRVDLERTLEGVRNNPTPSCERTKLLTEASHELREAFAHAYGTMPTKDLLSLKRRFESDVTIVERRIAQDFVARIVKLLKGG